MNTIEELLTITMEECGELTQECAKIMRFGQSQENLDRLEKEVGDVLCMIHLLHDYDLIRWKVLEDRINEKLRKLSIYSSIVDPYEDEETD